MQLRIQDSTMGRIVVRDDASGHEFAFRVETLKGAHRLEAFAPKWGDGQEPSSANRYIIEARALAEREAVDQGWIELPDARASEAGDDAAV
jgi:hypothetical protein